MMRSASGMMFYCVGVNFRACPIAQREQVAVATAKLPLLLERINSHDSIEECVVLSTCNRTEIYVWTADTLLAKKHILSCLVGDCDEMLHFFYEYSHLEALTHLIHVAVGLDSMILGETEIFGQLKEAYRQAAGAGSTAARLNRLFQRVFTIAKKARHETCITRGPTSIGAAAVRVAISQMGSIAGKQILLVGAGDVARSTAKNLHAQGAEALFVANRSYERALELAEQVGGEVIRFSEWQPYFTQVDIAIVSTASPVFVVRYEELLTIQEKRQHRPLLLLDLSVPRNVDPRCASIEGVLLSDIDQFQLLHTQSEEKRHGEIANCHRLIEIWLQDEAGALLGQKVIPVVQ